MPKLAAFPKLYMQALCKDGTMSVSEWIDQAAELGVDGLEWYAGFLEMQDRGNWAGLRAKVESPCETLPPREGMGAAWGGFLVSESAEKQ